jgi:hypothetical protein
LLVSLKSQQRLSMIPQPLSYRSPIEGNVRLTDGQRSVLF